MKINWPARLRNKPFLAAFAALVITFVYDTLTLLGIAPSVSESMVMGVLNAALTLMVGAGLLIDPAAHEAGEGKRAETGEAQIEQKEQEEQKE
ncbi:MAG: phage holin, partial [Clostridia bacterium]|nr:phage holin [Clostridia bacterium]